MTPTHTRPVDVYAVEQQAHALRAQATLEAFRALRVWIRAHLSTTKGQEIA
jgi:hypothetical protein